MNNLEELKPVKLALEKIFDSVHYSKSEVSQKHIYDEVKKKVLDECKTCPDKKQSSSILQPPRILSTPIIQSARDRSSEYPKHFIDDSFGSPSNKKDKSSDMKPPSHILQKSTDPSGLRESLELIGKIDNQEIILQDQSQSSMYLCLLKPRKNLRKI